MINDYSIVVSSPLLRAYSFNLTTYIFIMTQPFKHA